MKENGPHEEAEFTTEDEVDEDEVPSATSRSEELLEDDEVEERPLKRLRRKSGDSASASSALKEAGLEDEDDEDEEPPVTRQRRRSGDSASASSPLKDAVVENEGEASESSLGARHTNDPAEPLTVTPLGCASPPKFARMPSVSLESEEDMDVTRLAT